MDLGLLYPHISLKQPTRWVAKGMSRPSVLKYDKLNNDAFIKEKLPVLNCAGSFSLPVSLAGVLKEMSQKEIYKLKFKVNHETKTVLAKDNPRLSIAINNYIKQIPEFFYNFRPKTDEKDLPHHSLATFRNVLLDPEYETLSYGMKKIMNYIAPAHDTGKTLDSTPDHAALSSRMLAKSLENVLSKEHAELAINLLADHHYTYNITNKIHSYEYYANKYTQDVFKMVKILTDADLASKERSFKNLRRIVENKAIFQQQADYNKNYRRELVG